VVEPDPVPGLMSQGASKVEGSHGTSRKGRVEHNDTIVLGVGRVVSGEGGVTEETRGVTGRETDGIDVKRVGGSLSESVLHLGLLGGVWSGLVEPAGVHGPGGVHQLEAETSAGVILIQNVDLIGDLGISEADDRNWETGQEGRQISLRHVTSSKGLVGVDNIEVDGDRVTRGDGVDLDAEITLCDKRGKGLLVLAEDVGGDISTTLATGSPRLNGV